VKSAILSPLERARAYLAKIPSAISGAGGHDKTFTAACALVRFGLSASEAWPLLLEYNARCSPPWNERELEHKLRDAYLRASVGFHLNHRMQTCAPKIKIDPASAIENYLGGFRVDEVELWEASPIRPPDDWTLDAICLASCLYQQGEVINFVTEYRTETKVDGTTKATPFGNGESLERDALINRWRKQGMPRSDAGGWLRMNPLNGRGVADANVTAFRFALLECDRVPLDLQLSLFAKLPLPIAVILSSGGRSFHAWIRIDETTVEAYKRTVSQMLALLSKFGVDGKNKNPSRLSRLPGVVRTIGAAGDGRQRLLYLNPEPKQKAIL
jgi:hypothetical protein